MILSLYLLLSQSKAPIVLIPGTMGSILKGSVTGRSTHWYCPKNVKTQTMWISKDYSIPPLINCLGDWLSMKYNSSLKDATNQDGVQMDIFDFGGVGGITFLDDFANLTNFIPYYKKYIDYLENHGYIVGKDLFGAPFDWRRGIMLGNTYFTQLKQLIESAFRKNSNQKVSLVGHSLGGFLIQHFLTNITTAEWRSKYIESANLVAPSFGGSGTIIENIWNGALSIMTYFGASSTEMEKMSSSFGSMYDQLPNFNLFGDKIVFIDENAKSYAARDLPQLFKKYGKFRSTPEIWELHKNTPSSIPKPIDVPTVITYNDKISTPIGYNDMLKQYIYADGDALINSEGPNYACKNWKSNSKLICQNLNTPNHSASHIMMILDDEYIDRVLKYSMDNEWTK